MSEQLAIPSSESSEPFEAEVLDVSLTTAEALFEQQHELDEALVSFSKEELAQLGYDAEPTTLQEKYNLAYEPEIAVRGVGSIALTELMTGNAQGEIATMLIEETDERASIERGGVSYAQDQPEYAPYTGSAEAIVAGLLEGDWSVVSGLPGKFQQALVARMQFRLGQLENGQMSEDEFRTECEKMISVACIGLKIADKGEE